jgi:hypothetical protein
VTEVEESQSLDVGNTEVIHIADRECDFYEFFRDTSALVGRSVNLVTLRAPLLGQFCVALLGKGMPFPVKCALSWLSSGAPFGPRLKRHWRCYARLN